MKPLENGSVTSPKGFLASGISAGMKKSGSPDLALIFSKTPCQFAGAFTQNSFSAAPVIYCKELFKKTQSAQAIVVNSGNANACTGDQGLENTKTMAATTASCLQIHQEEVFVSSTGRIGVQLSMEKIKKGIGIAKDRLSKTGGLDAAKAILTTDNRIKSCAVEIQDNEHKITIGGIAKGAGMLYPRMKSACLHATMLAYITTDAVIETEVLRNCLENSLDQSFNRISVDGDTSTNDSFIALANGQAENPMIKKGSKEETIFQNAFDYVAAELAKMMVRDGEGATKFVEIIVTGAHSNSEARLCAETIANSLLCKTAWFGEDPNWGRILDAVGYSGVKVDPKTFRLTYDHVPVFHGGMDANSSESERAKVLKNPEFQIRLDLGIGKGTCTFWTSDLTYEYIKINAEYRT